MTAKNTQERLEALERALAHQDVTLEELNGVVAEQWTVIDRLTKEIEFLRDRLGQLEYETRKAPTEDKPPPHY
jgi:SlyX protein